MRESPMPPYWNYTSDCLNIRWSSCCRSRRQERTPRCIISIDYRLRSMIFFANSWPSHMHHCPHMHVYHLLHIPCMAEEQSQIFRSPLVRKPRSINGTATCCSSYSNAIRNVLEAWIVHAATPSSPLTSLDYTSISMVR